MSEKMRAEFEVWLTKNVGSSLDHDCKNEYLSFKTLQLWWAWQASRETLVIELPSPYTNEYGPGIGFRSGIDEAERAIRSAGLKVETVERKIASMPIGR